MVRLIDYPYKGHDGIIILVNISNKFYWYVMEKEMWVLDLKKWQEETMSIIKEKREKLPVEELPDFIRDINKLKEWESIPIDSDRLGFPILNEKNIKKYLNTIYNYKLTYGELEEFLKSYFETIGKQGLKYPEFYIDVSNKTFYNFYPEPGSYEEYVPDGWKGLYSNYPDKIVPQQAFLSKEKEKQFLVDLKKIYANYGNGTIRVYQAYNERIASQAVELGKFGSNFSMTRMSWIKTSFLWMMSRSGWGTKENQERILAIDISIDGFREILSRVILSSYEEKLYGNYEEWKKVLETSEVRCQWDPDKDLYLRPMLQRAIQIGIKGRMLEKYVNEWIKSIEDITDYVYEIKSLIDSDKLNKIILPFEREFPLTDVEKRLLGVILD